MPSKPRAEESCGQLPEGQISGHRNTCFHQVIQVGYLGRAEKPLFYGRNRCPPGTGFRSAQDLGTAAKGAVPLSEMRCWVAPGTVPVVSGIFCPVSPRALTASSPHPCLVVGSPVPDPVLNHQA